MLIHFSLLLPLAPVGAQCPSVATGFEAGNLGGTCNALVVHDDGTCSQLYAGGLFARAGTTTVGNIARWNGASWSAVGTLAGPVHALCVFDDGSSAGAQLYAGGEFVSSGTGDAPRVARWDGTAWHPLGEGLGGRVYALTVFDDGTGPALYAGGEFAASGTTTVNSVARWDGTSWSSLGSGIQTGAFAGIVRALVVHDDGLGGGPALYAGGRFLTAGGVSAVHAARWNGSSWSALGSGVSGGIAFGGTSIFDLAVFDEGTGPRLFASGAFDTAGGIPANLLARWDGTVWSATGLTPPLGQIQALAMDVFDAGNGPALHVATSTLTLYSQPRATVRSWNGSAWSATGPDLGFKVHALCPFGHSGSVALHAGGVLDQVQNAGFVSRFEGARWTPLQGGLGASDPVSASTTFDFGNGPELVVAGEASSFGGEAAGVASWNGSQWTDRGAVPAYAPASFATFDDGLGPALYAGSANEGTFSIAALHRWNGSAWEPVPGAPAAGGPSIHALAVHDDGSGSALYAAGDIPAGNTGPGVEVRRWNGASWSTVGPAFNFGIRALVVFDDGSGSRLYAGGTFTSIGGAPITRVARWDGSSWSAVGSGFAGGGAPGVRCFGIHDDGQGPKLIAGGTFTTADGAPCLGIARWSGSQWQPLGTGLARVYAIASFDAGDGLGALLHATGSFYQSSGIVLQHLAKFDGAAWSSVGGGLTTTAGLIEGSTLRTHDDGHGPVLFVGGDFTSIGDVPSAHVGWLRACADTGRVVCVGDGGSVGCPCGNDSATGAGEGCRSSTGIGARLRASGLASITVDTLRLAGDQMTNGAVLYFQGSTALGAGAGAPFGDGLRCAGGMVRRLDIEANVGGASQYPSPLDPAISVAGSTLAGRAYVYQAWYRDAQPFCTGATFNLTNGVTISWVP